MERGKNIESLPTDLILEIFKRLPAKSVARFRIVSKHWASMLRSPGFTKLFLTSSSTRPRLLFAVKRFLRNELQYFSTPNPQNRYQTSSHVEFHTKFKGVVSPPYGCSYASGLIYVPNVRISGENTHLICNPVTGMYVRLPAVERPLYTEVFLGFDPIDKHFKFVSDETYSYYLNSRVRHKTLTLGSSGVGDLEWKGDIPCAAYGCSSKKGICINGILYYLAVNFDQHRQSSFVIVRFDVRSEQFKIIDAACFNQGLGLVNYKGKLAGITYCKYVLNAAAQGRGRTTVELSMWVLEDVEKQEEWVKYVYTSPENEILDQYFCDDDFSVAGVTATGDIVLFMRYICKPFYVFYFNPERNTLQSVEIQGFGANPEAFKNHGRVYAFVDHVEDLTVNDPKHL